MTSEPEPSRHRTLYKDREHGKISGVCAGVAEYFGFETWVVRLIAVSLLLFMNGGMVLAYFLASWLLDPKPGSSKTRRGRAQRYCSAAGTSRSGPAAHSKPQTGSQQPYRPRLQEVWKKDFSATSELETVKKSFAGLEQRLRHLESFVTSDTFRLHQEFAKIKE